MYVFTVVNFIEHGEKESFKYLTNKNLDFWRWPPFGYYCIRNSHVFRW